MHIYKYRCPVCGSEWGNYLTEGVAKLGKAEHIEQNHPAQYYQLLRAAQTGVAQTAGEEVTITYV